MPIILPPPPAPTEAANELWDRLGPWREEDAATVDKPLLDVCEAIMGRLQPVEDVVRDQDDAPGWSQVLDVDRCPSAWLPWMAQFVGVRIPLGATDAEARLLIHSTGGFSRGTPGAMILAIKQHLSGTKTVFLTERHGSAYRLTVATLVAETLDPDLVEKAARAQKPAGIVMNAAATDGSDYAALRDTHSSYAVLPSVYVDYVEVLADPIKQA